MKKNIFLFEMQRTIYPNNDKMGGIEKDFKDSTQLNNYQCFLLMSFFYFINH